MEDKLKEFYLAVLNLESLKKLHLREDNNTRWISIFCEKKRSDSIAIGITAGGEWIYKDAKHLFVIDEIKKFLYCVHLTEIPFGNIVATLEQEFVDILPISNIDAQHIFPFLQIIKHILNYLLSDYWFELAMIWYKKLQTPLQLCLINDFKSIVNSKRISQKNRQKVKYEIRRLRRQDEGPSD